MKTNQLTEILRENSKIDPTAIERSSQAAKQLAEVGIKLGGYRLAPALGGQLLKNPGQSAK